MQDLANVTIRSATMDDIPVLVEMIRHLATYEKLERSNCISEEALRAEFSRAEPTLQVIVAEVAGDVVGMASFFETYSTFAARCGMYVEDIFVQESHRFRGIGKRLFRHLAHLAKERDYGRIEWTSLLWNTSAAEFYESLGAAPSDVWSTYRLSGAFLDQLARAGEAEHAEAGE